MNVLVAQGCRRRGNREEQMPCGIYGSASLPWFRGLPLDLGLP